MRVRVVVRVVAGVSRAEGETWRPSADTALAHTREPPRCMPDEMKTLASSMKESPTVMSSGTVFSRSMRAASVETCILRKVAGCCSVPARSKAPPARTDEALPVSPDIHANWLNSMVIAK